MRALVIGPKDRDKDLSRTENLSWISGPMSDLIGSVIEVTEVKEKPSIYHGELRYWRKDWLKILND